MIRAGGRGVRRPWADAITTAAMQGVRRQVHLTPGVQNLTITAIPPWETSVDTPTPDTAHRRERHRLTGGATPAAVLDVPGGVNLTTIVHGTIAVRIARQAGLVTTAIDTHRRSTRLGLATRATGAAVVHVDGDVATNTTTVALMGLTGDRAGASQTQLSSSTFTLAFTAVAWRGAEIHTTCAATGGQAFDALAGTLDTDVPRRTGDATAATVLAILLDVRTVRR